MSNKRPGATGLEVLEASWRNEKDFRQSVSEGLSVDLDLIRSMDLSEDDADIMEVLQVKLGPDRAAKTLAVMRYLSRISRQVDSAETVVDRLLELAAAGGEDESITVDEKELRPVLVDVIGSSFAGSRRRHVQSTFLTNLQAVEVTLDMLSLIHI